MLVAAATAVWSFVVRRKSRGIEAKIPLQFMDDIIQWTDVARKSAIGLPHVTPDLALAVIARESLGNPDASGAVGELGLMQVGKAAWTDYIMQHPNDAGAQTFQDVANPETNVRVGTWFLNQQIEAMGNTFDGLRAYNAGVSGASRSRNVSVEYARAVLSYRKQFLRVV